MQPCDAQQQWLLRAKPRQLANSVLPKPPRPFEVGPPLWSGAPKRRPTPAISASMGDVARLEKELTAAGIEVRGGTSESTMRAALQAHFSGQDKSAAEVFALLDADGSGALDRMEVEQAAGMLGSALGSVMTKQETEQAFREMDPDGDGQVTLEEFEAWWRGIEAETLISDMEEEDVAEALIEAGIDVVGSGAKPSMATMKEALKAHYAGKEMTTRQVFDALDEDKSGFLDRDEVAKASGMLSAGLGFVMSGEELDRQFKIMDPDGDGEVTFTEFAAWWKSVEADQLVSDMEQEDVLEALEEAGIKAMDSGLASMASMKAALKQHYAGKDMTTRQVFDALDEDKSGFLDRDEVAKASGMLSAGLGFVMSGEELDRQFKIMDPDGDGEVTFTEFEAWWKSVEADQLVGDMEQEDVLEALEEAGITPQTGTSIVSMREALKTHYAGRDLSAKAVFESLDLDGSGFLDRGEVEKAAGTLGAALGTLMSEDELEVCFSSMDPDGDGEVTLQEFELWWNDKTVDSMDATTVAAALTEAGIAVMKGGASEVSQKEALKVHLSGEKLSLRQVFEKIDLDGSGFLDRGEVEKAAGMLGASLGFVMNAAMIEKAWHAMQPDEDGEVTFAKFAMWWKGVQRGEMVPSAASPSPRRRAAGPKSSPSPASSPAAAGDVTALQQLQAKEQQMRQTQQLKDAGTAALYAEEGVMLTKYTSKKPPTREDRVFHFSTKRDISWRKTKAKPGAGTILKARKGDVRKLGYGMALSDRSLEDVATDPGWRSFYLVGTERLYQFTAPDEDTFYKVYLGLHDLLRQIGLQAGMDSMVEEVDIAALKLQVAAYKAKDAAAAPEGHVVKLGFDPSAAPSLREGVAKMQKQGSATDAAAAATAAAEAAGVAGAAALKIPEGVPKSGKATAKGAKEAAAKAVKEQAKNGPANAKDAKKAKADAAAAAKKAKADTVAAAKQAKADAVAAAKQAKIDAVAAAKKAKADAKLAKSKKS
jgi:Ca2+-binding EF-hand superfamily protein